MNNNKNNFGLNWQFLRSRLALFVTGCVCSSAIILSPLASLAGDPFRSNNPKNISSEAEFAFKTVFEDGDYLKAKNYLQNLENVPNNDPLVPALKASLAYTYEDWDNIDTYTKQTLKTAESIVSTDPLRGNLYLAVGHFLDGANEYKKNGAVAALSKLQLVFEYFEKAEKIDSKDPEYNLVKGYLNLLLAVHLPFSSPEDAIENLQTYASPKYLVNRGIAVAYRDMQDYNQALDFVNKAIESTPLNPELYYLKGQILKKKGQKENSKELLQQAIDNFDIALTKVEQLPEKTAQKPLKREKRKTLEYIDKLSTTSSK